MPDLPSSGPAVGTIAANPNFVNYQTDGSGNYHLNFNNPAVNAGTGIGAPSTDFNGISRRRGSAYDIGPHSFVNNRK